MFVGHGGAASFASCQFEGNASRMVRPALARRGAPSPAAPRAERGRGGGARWGPFAQDPAAAALRLGGHPKEDFTDAEANAAQPITMAAVR